ncbi:hypothetical protein DM01DRAFT_1391801 [Hesseltinella vesiculosa]|uniref:Uncharacterized protein n=1 Tax=Hesseltinella vesiculosa TaxID=101127 RepID=A0A1X2GEA9_9FUNG|nr:hypothetical protein DM01DRAFT_1391801 [Hesseltinella vesiculosa]
MTLPPMTASVAACIVLGYDANDTANHDLAMKHMQQLDMVPVHTYDSNPVHPTAVLRRVQQMNPYIYLMYPTEDIMEHSRRRDSSSSQASESCYEFVTSNSIESLPDSIRNAKAKITQNEALNHLKTVISLEHPIGDPDMYEKLLVDSTKLKEMLERRFGPLTTTPRQIEGWVNKSNIWGQRYKTRKNGTLVEGRDLWVLKEKYLGKDNGNEM